MRTLLMASLLTAAATLAQGQNSNPSNQPTPNVDELKARALAAAQRSAEDDFTDRGTCYTMRSYLFARNDGKAPRLVGMTTCTAGNRYRIYRAQQRPSFGLYPATANSAPAANAVQSKSERH
jgi:hypothetical protein